MRNLKPISTNQGFTLTELMIAIMLGMSIISSVLIGYLATYSGSVGTLANSKLSQEMSTLMDLMISDIRRAGFNGIELLDPSTNLFSQINNTAVEVFNDFNATQVGNNGNGFCITFAYDRDQDGNVDATNTTDNELFGFRLKGGAVQTRTLGAIAAPDTCADLNNTWENLTDPNFVTITTLDFDLASAACLNVSEPDGDDDDSDGTDDNDEEYDCYDTIPAGASGDITVETRQLTITLEGELANDSFVKMAMTQNVRVRNDLVRVW